MINDKGSPSFRLSLLTSNGDLPLTWTYATGGNRYGEVRDVVDRALGLAPISRNESDEADIHAMLIKGRTVGAISLVRQQRGCSLVEAKNIVDGMAKSS